jgi:tetratricopeptide (TPR) repeat protein
VLPYRMAAASAAALVALASVLAQDAQTPPAASPPPAGDAGALAPGTPAAPPAPAALSETGAAALQRAKDAFKTGSWPEALAAATEVLGEQPKNLDALYIAGASERQTALYPAAEGHLKALIDTSPNFPLAHYQLGYVAYLEAESSARDGKAEEAKAAYSLSADEFGKELERNPTHTASLSSRARALARAGRFDDALKAHDAWIAAVPGKNDAFQSLAVTYALAGKSSEAMQTLDRLPVKDGRAPFDATMTVTGVFLARKDWGAAVPFLEKAVQADATSVHARSLLTQAYARAMQYDDAVASLKVLLDMNPPPDEAEAAGEAIKATIGNGKSSVSRPGVDPPSVLKIPFPHYPKGQDDSVETEVLVLAKISGSAKVEDTLVVPNRIWKDLRTTGFEQEAIDTVKRGRFTAGTKDRQPADLWLVVAVKFSKP